VPELPEVDALRHLLAERVVGRRISRVQPFAVSVLKTYDPPPDALEGRTVTAVHRHGKFLDIVCGDLRLVTHLARAGWLRHHGTLPATPPRPGSRNPLALRVTLDDGSGFDLTEAGSRKRLAVYVVRDPLEVPGVARLGADPLGEGFDRAAFAALLGGGEQRRRRIKGVLRDQSVLAGIGNAYADEILHAARMSPFKPAANLSAEEAALLHDTVVTTLTEAVERARGLALQDLKAEKKSGLQVHGRTGEACPVCGDTVREVSFSDWSTQYCPTCQTGGRILADRRMSRLLK
jgi:formamidopyrimidine-DNA glycosylase